MELHDEIYFEITVEGTKEDVQKFASFVTSGELDEFFEFTSDFIIYDDDFNKKPSSERVSISLANDDFGIEADYFNPEDFLDVLCSAGRSLLIHGNIYDIEDEEFRFISNFGEAGFVNADDIKYNDELDEEAEREEDEDLIADDFE